MNDDNRRHAIDALRGLTRRSPGADFSGRVMQGLPKGRPSRLAELKYRLSRTPDAIESASILHAVTAVYFAINGLVLNIALPRMTLHFESLPWVMLQPYFAIIAACFYALLALLIRRNARGAAVGAYLFTLLHIAFLAVNGYVLRRTLYVDEGIAMLTFYVLMQIVVCGLPAIPLESARLMSKFRGILKPASLHVL